jgi:hypothetical protein
MGSCFQAPQGAAQRAHDFSALLGTVGGEDFSGERLNTVGE